MVNSESMAAATTATTAITESICSTKNSSYSHT